MTLIEKDRMDIMDDKLTVVEQKIDRVLNALLGDGLNTDEGLVAEFKALRERVATIEAKANRAIWIAIGAGVGGGISLSTVIQWIKESAILNN